MDEFDIIRRYFTPSKYDDSVIVGVGDDGAVLRPVTGRDLVTVADTMVAGVHYPDGLPAADVGYRAVAVNVSDIAAMGARPRWMTLALTVSGDAGHWLAEFAGGIAAAASESGVDLVGGDLTRGVQTVINVQITGDVDPRRVLRRDGARPGDGIFVSGTPGDAAMGLRILEGGKPAGEHGASLVRRFARPAARIALGHAIAPHASAAIDVSDGLYADLEKLLTASSVAGCIELDDLPLSADLLATVDRAAAERLALGGGDDYELCFTAPDDGFFASAEIAGVRVTRLGEVAGGSGLRCEKGGQSFDYRDSGYRHFQ